MLNQVVWTSCQRLSCSNQETPSVVLCLNLSNLIAPPNCPDDTPQPFLYYTIEATLTKSWRDADTCGNARYRYLFAYDTTELNDPNTPLTTGQIAGVFCKGCLTSWIEEKIGNEATVTANPDGTFTFVSQHGCTTTISTTGNTFSDTNTVDLTATPSSGGIDVTADVILSIDDQNILETRSNGLYVPPDFILAVNPSLTVDLEVSSGVLTAEAKISANPNNHLLLNPDGLFVPPAPTDFIGSVTDTPSVDLTVTGVALSADAKVSPDAGNSLSIHGNGLFVSTPPAAVVTAITDTNSVDLALIGTTLSADAKISADAGNQVSTHADGLFVPAPSGNFVTAIGDTNSVDLSVTGTTLTADSKISPDAGNQVSIHPNGLFVPAPPAGFVTGIADSSSIDLSVFGSTLSADAKISATLGNGLSVQGDGLYESSIRRNFLIGGDFSTNPWQRKYAATLVVPGGSALYCADRWKVFRNSLVAGAEATMTFLSVGDIPGTMHSHRVKRTTGVTTLPSMYMVQALESQDSYALQGQTVTLSFYARKGADFSAASSFLYSRITTGTGTDESPEGAITGAVVQQIPHTLTTSWQKFTYTPTLASNLTQVFVSFIYDPTGTAGANDWFEVALVQLEIGPVATKFQALSVGDVLARCKRYYEKSFPIGQDPIQNIGSINGALAAQITNVSFYLYMYLQFAVAKRATPVVTLLNPLAANGNVRNVNIVSGDFTTCSAIDIFSNACHVAAQTAPAGTLVGHLCCVHWTAEADL